MSEAPKRIGSDVYAPRSPQNDELARRARLTMRVRLDRSKPVPKLAVNSWPSEPIICQVAPTLLTPTIGPLAKPNTCRRSSPRATKIRAPPHECQPDLGGSESDQFEEVGDVARPIPTPLFHFTRVEHLPTIIGSGIHCDVAAKTRGLLLKEVGEPGIKQSRRSRQVLVPPGGVVADYAPFYFAPRSPMLYRIVHGGVPSYTDGDARIVYLCTTIERLTELRLDPVLTDRNAAKRYAEFHRFSDGEPAEDFVDWPLMTAKMWRNDADHPDRMERRMAECLVPGGVPWEAIQFVGAKSQTLVDEVQAVLVGATHTPRVEIRREWYF